MSEANKHPTSFRLSDDAIKALDRLTGGKPRGRSKLVEKLILDAADVDPLAQILDRLESLEERLKNLEALNAPDRIIDC